MKMKLRGQGATRELGSNLNFEVPVRRTKKLKTVPSLKRVKSQARVLFNVPFPLFNLKTMVVH
jgi:hypothetical protein